MPVEMTPDLNWIISSGVVNLISPLTAISVPPARFIKVPKALPNLITICSGKSSETFPLISYSRKI